MPLYDAFLALAAAIFVVAAGGIGWSIVRHRGAGDGREPPMLHENLRLELLWWALPTALALVLFLLAAQVLGAGAVAAPDGTVLVSGLDVRRPVAG